MPVHSTPKITNNLVENPECLNNLKIQSEPQEKPLYYQSSGTIAHAKICMNRFEKCKQTVTKQLIASKKCK
ncbi:hypothetical protein OnM2_022082 [Erysiphe neolycopersici]|uniref:Uncharacterized protein n=1 Tax=Erysiphe neolycopersici TaxID=212602 RepID=A0A420I2B3_9PEZI|nr:hypothetical protein OnM2_022082 [Erysiphe neolycopersici]